MFCARPFHLHKTCFVNNKGSFTVAQRGLFVRPEAGAKGNNNIVLVGAYCDDETLAPLSQKRGGAKNTIIMTQKANSKCLPSTAVDKFNKQNPMPTVKAVGIFHDRYLILDGQELNHFGVSLKGLGRQYCAVTKMDSMFIPSGMARI